MLLHHNHQNQHVVVKVVVTIMISVEVKIGKVLQPVYRVNVKNSVTSFLNVYQRKMMVMV